MRGKRPGHKYTWWIFIHCSSIGILYVYTIIVIIIEEKVWLRPSYRKLFFDLVERGSTHGENAVRVRIETNIDGE